MADERETSMLCEGSNGCFVDHCGETSGKGCQDSQPRSEAQIEFETLDLGSSGRQ